MNPILVLLSRGLKLGRIAGIPITINWTWIPIALVMTGQISEFTHAGVLGFFLGLLGTALFFGSILAHELGHALAARTVGIGTLDITLHLLGGVARLAREPRRPQEEMTIAIAGPAVSLALGGLFFGIDLFVRSLPIRPAFTDLVQWIAAANIFLAVFNLLPGLPLDGGRVLRAWLWKRNGHYVPATVTAANVGEKIGTVLLVLSIVGIVFPFELPFGPMSALAAWFLISAARAERARVTPQASPAEEFLRRIFASRGMPAGAIFEALRRARPSQRPPAPPPAKSSDVIDVDYVVNRDRR